MFPASVHPSRTAILEFTRPETEGEAETSVLSRDFTADGYSEDIAMTAHEIVLTLSKAEALVLFEWLARLDLAATCGFEDPSEQIVVLKVQGQLESLLPEPFAPNYRDLLVEARRSVGPAQR